MRLSRLNGVIARRPAAAAVVALILGIACHRLAPPHPGVWLTGAAILLAAAVLIRDRPSLSSFAIAGAVFLAGLSDAQLAAFFYPRDDISAFLSDEPRLAQVRATVSDAPRLVDPASNGRRLPSRQILTADVAAVLGHRGWIPARGRMQVTISSPSRNLRAGDVIEMFGRLARQPPPMNPGEPDIAARERRERILASMYVPHGYDVQVQSPSRAWPNPLAAVHAAARDLLDCGFAAADARPAALLRTLVFGDREPALRPTEQDFQRTGTMHLLSANGTRVALLTGLVFLVCRLLAVPPRASVTASLVAAALLGCVALPTAQIVRPLIACAAVGTALLLRRLTDSLQILALAAVLILAWQPLELYSPGFQLGFLIVLAILLLSRPLIAYLETFEDPDRRVARSFLSPGSFANRAARVRRRILRTAAVATVAWAAAIPLVALDFNQFNLWTVPCSLLLAPLAATAMTAGLIKIALTALLPAGAALWAGAARPEALLLQHAVAALANVPLAHATVTPPPLWQIPLYYALLILPLLPTIPALRRWTRLAPVAGCAILLATPFVSVRVGGRSAPLRVTLLYVGAGQCAVIEPVAGEAVLIDAGSSTFSDPLHTCLEPFLRFEGDRRVDAVWLSHGDFDHISAVRELLGDMSVGEVITSPHFRRHAIESGPCRSLLETLDRSGRSPHLVCAGDSATLPGGARIDVLWPPAVCSLNSNNAGLVLRLTRAGRSILFPADIQQPAETELLRHPERLRADVLVAPHHGSAESTTAAFVAAVDPKIVVSSNADRLTMKQRIFETDIGQRPLYRTNRCGAITIEIDSEGALRVIPFRGTEAARPN